MFGSIYLSESTNITVVCEQKRPHIEKEPALIELFSHMESHVFPLEFLMTF